MVQLLDDYALISPLRSKNNWLKISIALFGILMGVSSQSPVTPLVIALCMGIATVKFSKVPLGFYLKILGGPAGFVLVSAVIIAFFAGTGTILFSFDIFSLTLSVSTGGLSMALLVVARSIGGMSCLFFLALSTPMIELFSVLKKTKFPDSFIEIAMMMYRYIFVFLEAAVGIQYAQAVRLGYKDFRTSFKSITMLSSTLFLRSWEQGEKLFISMNSRCYDGKLILFEEKKPVKLPDIVLTAAYFTLIIMVFYLTRDMYAV